MWFLKKKKTDPDNRTGPHSTTGRDGASGQDKTLGETLRSLKKMLAEKDIPAGEPTASDRATQKTAQQQAPPPPQRGADPSPADRTLRDRLDPTTTTWHDLSLDFDAEPLRPATPDTSVTDTAAAGTDAGEAAARVNDAPPATPEPPAADTETDLAGDSDPDVAVEDPQGTPEADKSTIEPEMDTPGEDSASLEPPGQEPHDAVPSTHSEGESADENIPTLEDIVYVPGIETGHTRPVNDAMSDNPPADATDIAAQTDQLVTLLRLRMGLGDGMPLSAAQEAVLRTTLVEFLQRRRSTDRQ